MKHVILLILFTGFQCVGQDYRNDPLPRIGKKPITTWSDEITGWSKSPDGQWISEQNTIPLRLNSRLSKKEYSEERKIGSDNIKELELYPVEYNSDTLVLLIKYAANGAFDYSETRRGWHNWVSVYYYVFNRSELSSLVNAGTEGNESVVIPLRAFGKISQLQGDAIEKLRVN
jgi:hypothetical protein